MLNVQFIDAGGCPMIDFDIPSAVPCDALERAWALLDIVKLDVKEVSQIVITKN